MSASNISTITTNSFPFLPSNVPEKGAASLLNLVKRPTELISDTTPIESVVTSLPLPHQTNVTSTQQQNLTYALPANSKLSFEQAKANTASSIAQRPAFSAVAINAYQLQQNVLSNLGSGASNSFNFQHLSTQSARTTAPSAVGLSTPAQNARYTLAYWTAADPASLSGVSVFA